MLPFPLWQVFYILFTLLFYYCIIHKVDIAVLYPIFPVIFNDFRTELFRRKT